jgi:hypothetical protein
MEDTKLFCKHLGTKHMMRGRMFSKKNDEREEGGTEGVRP